MLRLIPLSTLNQYGLSQNSRCILQYVARYNFTKFLHQLREKRGEGREERGERRELRELRAERREERGQRREKREERREARKLRV